MSIQHFVRVCKTEYSPKKSTIICAKCILVRDGQMTDVCYNTYKSQKKVGARMGGKTSTASKRKFNDKTYQRIVLDVRMDAFPNKEAVQVAAQKAGQSLTEYIMEAVRLRMEQKNTASDPGERVSLARKHRCLHPRIHGVHRLHGQFQDLHQLHLG